MKVTLLLLALAACSKPPEAPTAVAGEAPAGPPPAPECLSKADLADGTADQAVHKCANCALVMDGKPEHASTHAGYTFHSCSAGCKAALDKDPGAVLARACKD